MDLDEARARLQELDRSLVDALADRLEVAREIGREKKEAGVAIRDFRQEAEVLERAREAAAERDLPPGLVEEVFGAVIRDSLHVQEEAHVHAQYTAGERSAAVIGGAGKMGRWFATFLSAQGYHVHVEDPKGAPEGFEALGGLEEALDKDLVVVSVPIRTTRGVLDELWDAEGVVLDIASIKAPFEDLLREQAEGGMDVASIHPLWGPDTRTLAGRNLMVMDCGRPEAADAAVDVFDGTLARPVRIPLDDHDRAMAWTLGYAHAVNIVYASVLRDSGWDVGDLAGHGGSTFLRQSRLARDVVEEEPDLYHDIQAMNPHMPDVYDAIGRGLDRFVDVVGERGAFSEEMLEARRFMEAYEWESRS